MIFDTDEIEATSVDSLEEWLRGSEEINRVHLENQYKLYKWIGHQFKAKLILDLGTRKGTSAVAFADCRDNVVLTIDNRAYDFQGQWNKRINLSYGVKDIFDLYPTIYDVAEIIHLDVSHDGITEHKWLEDLNTTDFQGVLIMDDINSDKFPELRKVFSEIQQRKLILPPEISHFTGTGVVAFGDQVLKLIP